MEGLETLKGEDFKPGIIDSVRQIVPILRPTLARNYKLALPKYLRKTAEDDKVDIYEETCRTPVNLKKTSSGNNEDATSTIDHNSSAESLSIMNFEISSGFLQKTAQPVHALTSCPTCPGLFLIPPNRVNTADELKELIENFDRSANIYVRHVIAYKNCPMFVGELTSIHKLERDGFLPCLLELSVGSTVKRFLADCIPSGHYYISLPKTTHMTKKYRQRWLLAHLKPVRSSPSRDVVLELWASTDGIRYLLHKTVAFSVSPPITKKKKKGVVKQEGDKSTKERRPTTAPPKRKSKSVKDLKRIMDAKKVKVKPRRSSSATSVTIKTAATKKKLYSLLKNGKRKKS